MANAKHVAILMRIAAIAGLIIATPGASAQDPRDLLRKGETFAAIRLLRQQEALRPKDGETLLLLAQAYYVAGQKKLFLLKAAAAAEALPQSPEPHYALGRYYLDDLSRRDLAAAQFRQTLARAPGHAMALYHLGWCHEEDREPAEAARLYERSASWLGHLGLARLALDAGQPDRALVQGQAALRLRAGEPQVHALLAKLYQRQGDCRRAIPAFRRASELEPNNATHLYQLARCAAAVGDVGLQKESLKNYERVRTLYGSP